MKRIISTILIGICFHNLSMGQASLSKKQFDELWNKADSAAKIIINTGNTTKDLNAIERNNIKSFDVKQKTVTNTNFKKVDTTNLEELSTQPIVKGVSSKNKSNTKSKDITDIKDENSSTKELTSKALSTKKNSETKISEKKYSNDDFSTQPIVKGKMNKTESDNNTYTPPKKIFIDKTKNYKEFTFETNPIVNNNTSYTRRDEPLPKSKEEIEEAIPVNRKSNNTNVNNDNSFMKEAYAQYDKEADSLHTANKRRLDSIMKSLNIKVPIVINSSDFVDIYVNGGGTIINNDSKMYDHISILHTGIVQREYKTKNDGVQRTEKKISKDELTKLAQYMVDMGFFDFKNEYDCADEDAACNQRFGKSPQVVPMEISLITGQRKNKVKVALFSPKTEKNTVNYPANLEKIMNAIYTIVEK